MTEQKKRIALVVTAVVLALALIILFAALAMKGCKSSETDKKPGTESTTDKNNGKDD